MGAHIWTKTSSKSRSNKIIGRAAAGMQTWRKIIKAKRVPPTGGRNKTTSKKKPENRHR